ncbi:MAG: hypothetical protein KA751_15405, partial [Comamonas sp.]|nr:hypothetical protein [Comamonas sp.]
MAMTPSFSAPRSAMHALRLTPLASATGLMLMLCTPAHAQSSAPEPQVMGVQTVSVSRLGQTRAELAATVQVIDSEALNAQIQTGLNLKEALGHLV